MTNYAYVKFFKFIKILVYCWFNKNCLVYSKIFYAREKLVQWKLRWKFSLIKNLKTLFFCIELWIKLKSNFRRETGSLEVWKKFSMLSSTIFKNFMNFLEISNNSFFLNILQILIFSSKSTIFFLIIFFSWTSRLYQVCIRMRYMKIQNSI